MQMRFVLYCISFIIMALMLTVTSGAEVDPETAAGIWLFDDGTGEQARDTSKNGNHADFMGNPEWVQGKFGKALEFNGVDDYLISQSELGVSGNTERTILFWFNPASSEGFQPVVSWGTTGGQKMYWVEYNGNEGGPNTIRVCGYDADIYTQATLPEGEWHHVAVVYPGSVRDTQIYYDGESQEIIESAFIFSETLDTLDTPVTIGDSPDVRGLNRLPFAGIIDEVAIFNVALSETDIKSVMKGIEIALAVSPSSKLTTAWGFIKSD